MRNSREANYMHLEHVRFNKGGRNWFITECAYNCSLYKHVQNHTEVHVEKEEKLGEIIKEKNNFAMFVLVLYL